MLKWGIALTVFAGLAIALVIYNRLDDEIRRQVELRLERHYQGLRVTVRSARLVHGEGIEVRGLTISDPRAKGPRLELIEVEELFLGCKAEPQDLIAGALDISHVSLRGMTLFATHRGEQKLSCTQLLPLPWVSDGWPTVIVENSAVEILDPRTTPAALMHLTGLNLVLTPGDAPSSAEPGQPALPPIAAYRVRGSVQGQHLRGVEVFGAVDYKGGGWSLQGKVSELDFSPQFVASLPGWHAERVHLLRGLRAQTAVTFQLSHQPGAAEPLRFDVTGDCQRGRIDDPQLPFPLVDVRVDWRCHNGGVEIRELTARNGDMELWLSGRREGMQDGSPWSAQVVGRRIAIDRRLAEAEACPRSWREYWDRFLPTGTADIKASLRSDGQTVSADDIEARLINVAFTYQEFPYRLERAAGVVTWREQRLSAAVKAYAAEQEVRLDAAWNGGWEDGHGWLRGKVDELPLDEKLLSAMKPDVRDAVRSLRARGTCNVQALFEQPPRVAGQRPAAEHRVNVALNRCAVKYQRFPYPLDDVRGAIEVHNGRWTLGPLTGVNDTGLVECVGHMEPTSRGTQLVLQLTGTQVPLEEELRDALVDPQQRRLWDDLHPQGAVNIRCQISYLSGQPDLHLWARVRPQPDSVSIQPRWFPYRLENVGGEVFFQDGHVDLLSLSAQHGRTRVVETNGTIDFNADGGWRVNLTRLAIDRLELGRELTAALPERFRGALRELDPRGAINVEGQVQLSSGPEVSSPVSSQWKLTLDVHNGELNAGVKLEHLFGGATLDGSYQAGRLLCRGELDLDSLSYKDVQLTNLRGPLVVDDARIVLGAPAERGSGGAAPRHITADICGGKLYGDCGMLLSEPRDYRLDATLVQADLKRVSQELLSGRQELEGKILGQVHLAGRGRGTHNLRGYGELQLREADVYHLPAMVRLLSVLSVRQPDRSAFTESNVNFHIEAGHVYFDAIDFKGDAISLRGKGEMDLDAVLALNFYAVVGRDQVHLPLVGGVLRGASQQIMQIRVDGKLNDPEIRRLALPGVKKGLERLGIEMGRQSERDGGTTDVPRGARRPSGAVRR